jgi:hypothetical protein
MRKKTLVTLTVLALASVAAFAASRDGFMVTSNGRIVITKNRPDAAATVASSSSDPGDASLVRIFDNIGSYYPKGIYYCCQGWTIAGPITGQQQSFPELWEAAAFTPAADHTVTKIKVAAGWVLGVNGLVLSLYNDSGGVPGTAIKSWSLTNLPTFGCCALQVGTDAAGIPVKAGVQYWVVLKTNSKESNTLAAWNDNDTDQLTYRKMATYCSDDKEGSCGNNDAWTTFETAPAPAFAVLGSN